MRMADSNYAQTYAEWQRDPEGFWAEAAKFIDWFEPATTIFDPSLGVYGRWFVGASCNTCYNALDRHVAGGRADQAAIIYNSPVTKSKASFSYAEVLREVQTLAAILERFRRREGRPRCHLYAAHSGSGLRDAGLRALGCHSFGRFRWLCVEGIGNAARRCTS